MKQDKPLIAMMFGIVGGLPTEMFTQVMKRLGLTTVSTLEVMSMMRVKEGSWRLGILAAFGIGAWVGLAMYFSARVLGTTYFVVKAMLISMTVWSLLFNIFGTLGGNPNVGLLIKRYLLSEAHRD